MPAYIVGLLVLVGVIALYEYRLRRPEFIVLHEKSGKLTVRRGPFYPRHLSLPIRRTAHSLQVTADAVAAGNLEVRVKLAGTAVPSPEHLDALVRVGGFQSDAAARAVEELQVMLEGFVKQFTEQHDIDSLSSQKILDRVMEQAAVSSEKLGLEIVSLSAQSFEPMDPQIAEALRKQEQARILEQTEELSQQARIAAAKARVKADEEIVELENGLDLKKAKLQQAQLEEESLLARQRLQDELQRSRMRLQFEKEELEIIKNSPELLMLTPQAARLAEASQNLKNARTVISLSPQDLTQGFDIVGVFHSLLQRAMNGSEGQKAQPPAQQDVNRLKGTVAGKS